MEPVTSAEGKKGFYDESMGFIPADSLEKVTNPEGVKGYYHEKTGFIPEPSMAAPKRGIVGSIAHGASTFGTGFNTGLANVLGLPVDVINSALEVVGLGTKEPVMGSEFIKNKIMPAPTKPEGLVENIVNAAGEQLPGVMPGVGLASKIGRTGLAAKEAAKIVAGSGTGSGLARTYAPDSPMADLAAQITGAAAVNAPQIVRGAIGLTSPDLERKMLQRVNKFSTTLSPEERVRRLDTQLNEGIRTSEKGLEKSQKAVADINREIREKIVLLTDEGAVVDKGNVLVPAEKWRDVEMKKQPLPAKPREQINSIIEEFRDSNPDKLTLQQSQTFKQTINKELDDFYKAVHHSPDKTAQLAQAWVNKTKGKIADGLRNEISEVFPEVKSLNQREGSLIQLNKSLERSLNRIGNRDILSLKFLTALIHSPKTAVGEFILNNPKIQSTLAVAIRHSRLKGQKQMDIFLPGEPPNMGSLPSGPAHLNEGIPMTNWSGLKMEEGASMPRPIEGIPIPGTGGGSGLMTESDWDLIQRMKGENPMPLLFPEFKGGKALPPNIEMGEPSLLRAAARARRK